MVRGTERLPGEAKPRRPYDAVRIGEGLFLIGQDRLIVGLIRVMADGVKRPGKPGEATSLTNRIRLVICAQSNRKSQIGAGMPLLLPVEPETIEIGAIPCCSRVGLPKSCEIRFWVGWIYAAVKEGVDRLRK